MSSAEALRFRVDRVLRGGREVLRDVAHTADACTLHAIVGPNGAGKSTLLRALAGLERLEGSVSLGDRDLTACAPHARAERVAWVPQEPSVPEAVSVAHVVGLARASRGESRATVREKALRALDACGLAGLEARAFDALSAGQRQRVVLARALATEAPVLLLDEPFAALDLGASLALERLLRDLAHQGRIVIAVLHDLAQAARMADVVLVLRDGRTVVAGPPAVALAAPVLAEVWGVRPRGAGLAGFELAEGR